MAGFFVLSLRPILANLYALPLGLITFIGAVNVGYSVLGLTLGFRMKRPLWLILALVAANSFWTCVCLALAVCVAREARVLGLGHILFEAAYVATLAIVEWRHRHVLVRG